MRLVRSFSLCYVTLALASAACSSSSGGKADAGADGGKDGAASEGGGSDGALPDSSMNEADGSEDGSVTTEGGATSEGGPTEGGAVDGGTTSEGGGSEGGPNGGDGGGDSSPPADGGSEGGALVPASSDCTAPTHINLMTNAVDLTTTFEAADAATGLISPPCAAGAVSSEVFYSFNFSSSVYVYADTFGSSATTVLFFLSPSTNTANCSPITASTMTGDRLCSEAACTTSQSQVVGLFEPGPYILGVALVGGTSGTTTTHFQYALAPSGPSKQLPQGSSVQTGSTVGTGSINMPPCNAVGGENGFWWMNCPTDTGGQLAASTCDGGTTWESVIATEIPQAATTYACEDDSCLPGTSFTNTIPSGAGFRALILGGLTVGASGSYSMSVTRP